jgi:hypothetical protein
MKQIAFFLVALLAVVGTVASTSSSGRDDREAAPIFGIRVFPVYRGWRLISVAREKAAPTIFRAIL